MTTTKPAAIETGVTLPYRLALNISSLEMTEEQLIQLCSDNRDLRIELSADRELIIMPPVASEEGCRNSTWFFRWETGPSRMELAAFSAHLRVLPSLMAQCELPTFRGSPCPGGRR